MRMSLSRSRFATPVILGALLLLGSAPMPAAHAPQNGPIIVIAAPGGNWQLYRINPDGSGLKQITQMPSTSFSGWSPHVFADGERIVFTYGDGSGSTNIYVINIDGTGLQQITHDGVSSSAAPSPDGSHLVYDTYSPKTGRPAYLVTIDLADPNHRTRVTSDLYATYFGEYTPDGNHIVYSTTEEGVVDETWTMDVDGSEKRPLTAPAPEFCPGTASPNSAWLLLVKDCLGPRPSTIWAMNLHDNRLQPVTRSNGLTFDGGPAYSPDGEKIAFFRVRRTSKGKFTSMDLYTMNADGSTVRRVTTGLILGGAYGCTYNLGCLFPTWASRQ